jgi:hypothetical protein
MGHFGMPEGMPFRSYVYETRSGCFDLLTAVRGLERERIG